MKRINIHFPQEVILPCGERTIPSVKREDIIYRIINFYKITTAIRLRLINFKGVWLLTNTRWNSRPLGSPLEVKFEQNWKWTRKREGERNTVDGLCYDGGRQGSGGGGGGPLSPALPFRYQILVESTVHWENFARMP